MYVAGFDVSYTASEREAAACIVVFDSNTLQAVETQYHLYKPNVPYIPGELCIREKEGFLGALRKIHTSIDILAIDGNGAFHPERAGMHCTLGSVAGVRTFGIAKHYFFENPAALGQEKGSYIPLYQNGAVVCYALRTVDKRKPVFVSEGHLSTIDEIVDLSLRFTHKARIPELTRQPDVLSRQLLRDIFDIRKAGSCVLLSLRAKRL